jgi:hypothetical protein
MRTSQLSGPQWFDVTVLILFEQTIIIIEGTSSGGGIALDDLRLKSVNCASNSEKN